MSQSDVKTPDLESISTLNARFLGLIRRYLPIMKTNWRNLSIDIGTGELLQGLDQKEIEVISNTGILLFSTSFEKNHCSGRADKASDLYQELTDFKILLFPALREVLLESPPDTNYRYGLTDSTASFIRTTPWEKLLEYARDENFYFVPRVRQKLFWSDLIQAAKSGDDTEILFSRINANVSVL